MLAVAGVVALPTPRVRADAKAVVKMSDAPAAFLPAKVTVKVGDEVEWINTGKAIHSVTTAPPLPAGAESFDSGFLMPGAKWEHKFTVPGTYHYLCIPHANSGMSGVVVVTK